MQTEPLATYLTNHLASRHRRRGRYGRREHPGVRWTGLRRALQAGGGRNHPDVRSPLLLHRFFAQGLALGRLRGNAVKVSERQFPQLHRLAATHAQRLGLKRVPDVYVMESGGLLNAFATRFMGRDFVIVFSDVLELALAQGESAVGFIMGHELAHVWRGHLKHRWLTMPARIIPYIGLAYSRACEYTCDRIGAYCQPDGAIAGLLVLAAGKELHAHVDVKEYASQAETENNFWIRRAEVMSSHPRLPKRIAALLKAGVAVPARSQWARAAAA